MGLGKAIVHPKGADKPQWLNDDDYIFNVIGTHRAKDLNWPNIYEFQLLADHWAYQAIDKGYTPWAGGDHAPDDWDGTAVLLRNGELWGGSVNWSPHRMYTQNSDVIGYHPRKHKPPVIDPATVQACLAALPGENEAVSGAVMHGMCRRALEGLLSPPDPVEALVAELKEHCGVVPWPSANAAIDRMVRYVIDNFERKQS